MGIKRVKLNYRPVVKEQKTDTVYPVSWSHVNAVNQAIQRKVDVRGREQVTSIEAKKFIVKSLIKK